MSQEPEPAAAQYFVFDTSPLSHLAKAQLLGVLKALSSTREAVITDRVEAELRAGLHLVPELQSVLDAKWLKRRVLQSGTELHWYQLFAQRLVGRDGRNMGETSVLAWGMAKPPAEVVIDDAEARKIATEFQIPCRGTLRFIIDAINEGHLGRRLASDLADEVLASGARLPFDGGGFLGWADRQGLLHEYGSEISGR